MSNGKPVGPIWPAATGSTGPMGPTGPVGPGPTQGGFMGATGAFGPTGPTGPVDRTLLTRPIPGHQEYFLELAYDANWRRTVVRTRSSYTIGGSTERQMGRIVRHIGFIDNGAIRFHPSPELDQILDTLVRLCHETLRGEIIMKINPDNNAQGVPNPPFAKDLEKDGFWQRFIDDALPLATVSDVLLT